jgi:hypothetical protein
MMDSAFYNEKYFDFELLKIPAAFIKVNSENCSYAYDSCLRAAQRKETIVLIKERGYGVHSGIADFIKKTRYKYYHAVCSPNNQLKEILCKFLFLEFPEVVNFTYATEHDLTSSFIYLLKEDILHRKRNVNRIIILRNIDTLYVKSISTMGRLVKELKGVVGIVGTISSDGFEKLKIQGEHYTDTGDFVIDSSVQWETVPPPKPNELADYCIARGVLGKRVIDKIIKDYPNFIALERKIEGIKINLKEKGFLNENE